MDFCHLQLNEDKYYINNLIFFVVEYYKENEKCCLSK